jgi:hypothetical protein
VNKGTSLAAFGRSLLNLRTVANLFFNCHPCLLKATVRRLKLNPPHPVFELSGLRDYTLLESYFPGKVVRS